METVLKVKVSPGAAKNEIKGWNHGHLRIRVKASPEKGKANKELRRFLAKTLGIAISLVAIRSGETSRNKTVVIRGMSNDEVSRTLGKPD